MEVIIIEFSELEEGELFVHPNGYLYKKHSETHAIKESNFYPTEIPPDTRCTVFGGKR